MIEITCNNGFKFIYYGSIDIAAFDNGFISIVSDGSKPTDDNELLQLRCKTLDSIPLYEIQSIIGKDDDRGTSKTSIQPQT